MCSVCLITSVPQDKVGVGSAVFNASNQVGVAINVAIVTTILVEIGKKNEPTAFTATAAGLWWGVALGIVEALVALVFFKSRTSSLANEAELAAEKDAISSV